MAKSKFEYVKKFESRDECLPNCWIVVRLDGKGFHRFAEIHRFTKPNDSRALHLMTVAAKAVMDEFNEVLLAYGQSDEYSFVFRKDAQVHNRRGMKIATNVCSLFTSSYQFHWNDVLQDTKLQYPPSFDGRIVLYPTNRSLRDYLSWRQADCHVNNLYNTAFWTLVLKGSCSPKQAEERLRGTLSGQKNEILFSEFGINYNNEPELFKKGTVLVRKKLEEEDESVGNERSTDKSTNREKKKNRVRSTVVDLNCDIIREEFWNAHPDILGLYIDS